MKLERRLDKLELAANPEANVAESIRRALSEPGEWVSVPPADYVPGRSRLADAIWGDDEKTPCIL